MKIYLRDRVSKLYYAGGNHWTPKKDRALNLKSRATALAAINGKPASAVEAFFASDAVTGEAPVPLSRRGIRMAVLERSEPTWEKTMG